MDQQLIVLSLIAVAVLWIVGFAAWLALRAWRSRQLRGKFGPEYDYTLEQEGDWRTAEEMLLEREKRVKQLEIRALAPDEWNRYQAEWTGIQADFVDRPVEAVEKADRLIVEVMVSRGFPVEDFEQRSADISVFYPEFVSDYRRAHAFAERSRHEAVSTEELRQAMVYYHNLFDQLLEQEAAKDKKLEVAIS